MRARDFAFGLPLAALVGWGCSRAPEDRPARICSALAGPGPLSAQWSQLSPPPRLGGVLFVFAEADLPSIRTVLATLDLQNTEIFSCKSTAVVFVPGVDEAGAERIEQAIVARTKARAKVRTIIPP